MATKKTSTRGGRFRDAVLKTYEITRPDEVEMVEEAARLLDLVDGLDEAVRATGFTSKGSAGQTVINPCLSALQSARGELRNVLRQLRLPDPETGEDAVTEGARRAARARWER